MGASTHGRQTPGVNILTGIRSEAERARLFIYFTISFGGDKKKNAAIDAGNEICGQRRRQAGPAQDCLEFCLAWPAE